MKKSLMLAILVVAILAIGISSAFADTATVNGTLVAGKLTASDTVTVKATVNPKLVLAVTTPVGVSQTVDFGGAVDPGTVTGTQPVSLNVWSNKKYDVQIDKTGSFAAMGLITTLAASSANAKTLLAENAAGHLFNDTYSLNVPWSSDPIAYTATVVYTVVQN